MAGVANPPAPRDVVAHVHDLLTKRKHAVKRIYRVWSAGETGHDVDTVLFVTQANKARTARIWVEPADDKGAVKTMLEVSDGW